MKARTIGVFAALGVCAAVVFCVPSAWAIEGPPYYPDPISLDRASPSVIGFGNTPGDIYGQSGGPIMGGWDVGGPGPILHVADFTYGLVTPTDNNDGHSNNETGVNQQLVVYFSGDDLSQGAPMTAYRHQAVRLQAAGDRFVTNGQTSLSPMQVMAGAGPAIINGPVIPNPLNSINLLSLNQHNYNEIPSIGPFANNAYVPPLGSGATVMDDMDALELTPFDVTGDLVHDTPIFFSLDVQSPSLTTAPAGPFTASDILLSPPGMAGFNLYAADVTMGLGVGDELDALAVFDDGDLVMTPGIDYALFSLAPGSPSLGAMSPADIFVTDFNGLSMLYLPANAIGMLAADNVDAIDVEIWGGPASIEVFEPLLVPEPSTFVLLGMGVLGLLFYRRR